MVIRGHLPPEPPADGEHRVPALHSHPVLQSHETVGGGGEAAGVAAGCPYDEASLMACGIAGAGYAEALDKDTVGAGRVEASPQVHSTPSSWGCGLPPWKHRCAQARLQLVGPLLPRSEGVSRKYSSRWQRAVRRLTGGQSLELEERVGF